MGIQKRETFLTNICEHKNSNECYLQENEKLLKKNNTSSNDACIVKYAKFAFHFVVEMCCF